MSEHSTRTIEDLAGVVVTAIEPDNATSAVLTCSVASTPRVRVEANFCYASFDGRSPFHNSMCGVDLTLDPAGLGGAYAFESPIYLSTLQFPGCEEDFATSQQADQLLRRAGFKRVGPWEYIDPRCAMAPVARDEDIVDEGCPQCGAEAGEPCREHCTAPEGVSL